MSNPKKCLIQKNFTSSLKKLLQMLRKKIPKFYSDAEKGGGIKKQGIDLQLLIMSAALILLKKLTAVTFNKNCFNNFSSISQHHGTKVQSIGSV